jgi:hypothetical protein
MKYIQTFLLLAMIIIASTAIAQNPATSANQNGFTQADRDRLVRMEAILEQHEKRFDLLHDDMNKRFEEQRSTNTLIISLFTFLTATIITLAFWDRRSSLRPLEGRTKKVESEMEELKKGTRLEKVITAFQDLAKDNPKVAEILKNNHLL